MNAVKALVYKTLRLRRKTVLSGLAVWLFFYIIAASACLSLDFGTLSGGDTVTADDLSLFAYAASAMLGAGVMNAGDTAQSDAKCHWYRFEYTLPVSAKKAAAVRAFMPAALGAVSWVISLISTAVLYFLLHKPFGLNVIKTITLITLLFIILSEVSDVLTLKYKDPQAVSARLFGITAAVCVIANVILMSGNDGIFGKITSMTEEELNEFISSVMLQRLAQLRDTAFIFTPLILAAVIAGGYFLFAKQLERREN